MTNNQPVRGRRVSKFLNAGQNVLTAIHIFLFRLTRGVIGGWMLNSPVLLLTTTGRKTGRQWTVPLLYLADNDEMVVVASNVGAPKHPTWYLNLQANPQVAVEIKGKRKQAQAKTASPTEKERLWPLVTAMYPGYIQYQAVTSRNIPLVILHVLEE